MKRLTTKDFIKRAKSKWGNKYDYSKVKYIKNRLNVIIICKEHGEFSQRPDVHYKYGCKKCADDRKKISLENFIERSNSIHNNNYDYSYSNYSSYNENIIIICKKHGKFSQTPHNHLKGQGCPLCNGGIPYNSDEFIKRSNKVHSNKYSYDKCKYIKANKKVKVTCLYHGDFMIYPYNHINGRGCQMCSNLFPIMEKEWLDSLSISYSNRQYKIGSMKVDGFDPDKKIIYEFYGDFWHGNPNKYDKKDINPVNKLKFGDLYKNTINRERYLKSLGYKVVSIWESEYKNK